MDKAFDIRTLGQLIIDLVEKNADSSSGEVQLLGQSAYVGFKKWIKASEAISGAFVLSDNFQVLDGVVLPQFDRFDMET